MADEVQPEALLNINCKLQSDFPTTFSWLESKKVTLHPGQTLLIAFRYLITILYQITILRIRKALHSWTTRSLPIAKRTWSRKFILVEVSTILESTLSVFLERRAQVQEVQIHTSPNFQAILSIPKQYLPSISAFITCPSAPPDHPTRFTSPSGKGKEKAADPSITDFVPMQGTISEGAKTRQCT